jgi:hypothetical protein
VILKIDLQVTTWWFINNLMIGLQAEDVLIMETRDGNQGGA